MTQDLSRVAMYITGRSMLQELANDFLKKDGSRTVSSKFSAHAFVMHRLDIHALLCAAWDLTSKTQTMVCNYCYIVNEYNKLFR